MTDEWQKVPEAVRLAFAMKLAFQSHHRWPARSEPEAPGTVLPDQTPAPRPLSEDERAALKKAPRDAGPRCVTGRVVFDLASKFYVPELRTECVASRTKTRP